MIIPLLTLLFYVTEPVVDMREEPTRNSPVVSQALFCENVHIEKEENGWTLIKTSDAYKGWVPSTTLTPSEISYQPSLVTSRLASHLYANPDMTYGPLYTLPYGTPLELVDTIDHQWLKVALPGDRECYIRKGDIALEPTLKEKGELIPFAERFLNLPYTWGGRSSFGFDCSGFVQMLYKQLGIILPRDSCQQIEDPRFKTISLDDLEPGDLIFFGPSQNKTIHVGLYIGNESFIHTSRRENKPWLRISHLSDFEWSADPLCDNPYRTARQFVDEEIGAQHR